ncbi:hypothetical protein DRO55_02645 [Candidatus Bathyarchaeota archaeon]|nr:MAG: hypothetical protein DRO55_02645 [Candidatus Bathyarchaeota archaeon]
MAFSPFNLILQPFDTVKITGFSACLPVPNSLLNKGKKVIVEQIRRLGWSRVYGGVHLSVKKKIKAQRGQVL